MFNNYIVDLLLSPERHLGHLVLDNFKKHREENIFRIDGATGEEVSFSSMLQSSVKLARALRGAGFVPGDILVLASFNHIHQLVPFYAAIFNGMPLCGIDPYQSYDVVKCILNIIQPKVAFVEDINKEIFCQAANALGLNVKIITFSTGDITMTDFIEIYDDQSPIDKFQPIVFDIDNILLWITQTSSTTGGTLKLVSMKQQQVYESLLIPDKIEKTTELNVTSVSWISSYYSALKQLYTGFTVLTSSKGLNLEYIVNIINKYRPNFLRLATPVLCMILKSKIHCDLTCANQVTYTGSYMPAYSLNELKKRLRPDTVITVLYGCTEAMGAIGMLNYKISDSSLISNCFHPLPNKKIKLVDMETGVEITEPGKTGHLLYKGTLFSGFFKNPKATEEAFTEDGWYKTGDLIKRHKNGLYSFVERMVLMFIVSYNNSLITFGPTELETVIEFHPGVLEVCVTSVPHESEFWPVACVVRKPGRDVSAQEIKQLVAEKLHEAKQLRGGVVFLDALPKTHSGKVARCEVQEMVLRAHRE